VVTPSRKAIEPAAPRRRPEVHTPVPAPTQSSWSGGMITATAVAVVAVVVVGYLTIGGGLGPAAVPGAKPPNTVTDPPAKGPAPASVAVQRQNDDDATEAFMLVTKGRLDAAAAIVERIRRRDPNYNGLKNLEDALDLARQAERGGGRKPGQ
jgi:hypothetical protein